MTWVNLEDIGLSEISQSQMAKYCMIHLFEVSKIVKLIEKEDKMGVTKG